MDVEKITNIMTIEQFEKSSLAKYMTYDEYFSSALKKVSTFTFAKLNPNFDMKQSFVNMRIKTLDEHNKHSKKLIENYKDLEAVYLAMLKERNVIYTNLRKKYNVENNSDLLTAMSDKNSLVDQSLYNKSAKSVNEAYNNFIAALQTANYETHRVV